MERRVLSRLDIPDVSQSQTKLFVVIHEKIMKPKLCRATFYR